MNVVAESTRIAVGVPRGSPPEEARVALVPSVVPQLVKSGLDVIVERGAGESAGFPDADYEQHGAHLGTRRDALEADIVVRVRGWGLDGTGISTCRTPIRSSSRSPIRSANPSRSGRRPNTSSSRSPSISCRGSLARKGWMPCPRRRP
jgi:hypothetical protein